MGQGAAYADDAPDLPYAGNVRQLTREDLRVVQVDTTQDVQAASEGVVEDDPNLVEFMGKRFRLAETIGLMPLLRFANASKKGMDSDDMEGMVALYTVIRDTIDQRRPPKIDPETNQQSIDPMTGEPEWDGPSEWMLFEEHAIETKAEGEDLMDFVNRAMAVIAARPRRRREISSGGSPQTSEKSRGGWSSPVVPPQADGLVRVAELGR